jgi:Contractile injection system tube protein
MMSLVKAKLISSDGGGTIEFMFNPNQLAFQQQINLTKNSGARTGRGLPKVNFAYPEPCTLTINDILLDTYEEGGAKSVIPYIKQFEKAVNFLESGTDKKKRPPTYVFTWGSYQYIRCFVTSLAYKLTIFLPDGTPVRAKLDLTLEEIDESTSQPGMGTPSNTNRTGDSRSNRM